MTPERLDWMLANFPSSEYIAELVAEVRRLQNIAGDNLCRFDENAATTEARALPEAEFLESCRRFRQQVAADHGEVSGCQTIAQLEHRIVELEKTAYESIEAPDNARLDWLEDRIVNFIDLDDGRIIDVKGLSLRAAIDAAMAQEGK